MAKRAGDGTFLPGESGNPGGRPKGPVRFRTLYDKGNTDDFIFERLRFWAAGDDGGIAIKAIQEMREIRYGKSAVMDDNGDIVRDTVINVVFPDFMKKPE